MAPLRIVTIAAVVGICLRSNWAQADVGTFDDTPGASESSEGRARALLDEAYSLKSKGDLSGAERAFESARGAGAEPQLVALELGYLSATRGDRARARGYFREATLGSDSKLRAHASRELDALGPDEWLDSLPGAGASSSTTPRLGYLTATHDDMPSRAVSLPSRWWGDLYAEAYGWHRLDGPPLEDNLVPTLRVRALYRIGTEPDLNLYAVAQGTRDLASRARDGRGLSIIYADNRATFGVGAMARIWHKRLGLFAQAGPSARLVDDGGPSVELDVRAGAFLGLESARCAERSTESAFVFVPCAELYSELVYVNRFDDNVIGFARGRLGFTYWSAGPLLSQLLLEGRAALDGNGDFYNNFADAGAVHRIRFVEPLRFDVNTGIHGGSYFGIAGRDPLPSPLHYVELRLTAATYLEF